ncbi:hypothetical protein RclHR1_12690001 [Rhizophagus clarus]|uniref:RCC1-like domain-containing protein n=1 Tax=Rhizophagus clarus TaxID=94130 RepID=A0A2Z6R073_9GLOM|nr:hypothetical protein RclHR1_12690001 [Rhizophagus clarus]
MSKNLVSSNKRSLNKNPLLKPKRRRLFNFTVPIPRRLKQFGKVYVIGSNELSQCGIEGLESAKQLKLINNLEKFKIVDIIVGSIHNAAITDDGKIVTWGTNDHGALGQFTETPKSEEAISIYEAGKYNIINEEIPEYAEGLDNVNIVKVACRDNATFALSDQGHLYAMGTFKGKDGFIGFSYDKRIEQPIFTRYTLFKNFTIIDIVAGVDHALALTKDGDVYAWGSNEAFRLRKRNLERRPINSLIPFNLGLKYIVRLYAGSYHNFALDKSGKVWVFGFNNMGQCGAGDHISFAIDNDNKIYSWGFGDNYVLGNKSEKDEISPFQIQISNELVGSDIIRLSCGTSHVLFLIVQPTNDSDVTLT